VKLQIIEGEFMQKIVLGGGCFWCVEGALLGLKGVSSVIPGYSGGHTENPTYEEVCAKRSGHAEVVEVIFDEEIIPRRILLEVFFTCHDPTQLNRQGNDVGPQYRSVVFYKNEEEKNDTEEVIDYLQQNFVDDIVTEVSPLINFFVAEKIHHNYFANNPNNPYCAMVVSPKISKTRAKHASLYK
jgi:peptide-methionine (S)-S-oxide reductase|tara:strand:- start:709 stop:1260 length:552 start_codon:yes stop_codon:yes gene_type:complete